MLIGPGASTPEEEERFGVEYVRMGILLRVMMRK